MITKRQAMKIVHQLCTHQFALQGLFAQLQKHHPTSQSLRPLQATIQELDGVWKCLDEEIPSMDGAALQLDHEMLASMAGES